MILLFDAANTLIYKPKFYEVLVSVLKDYHINLDINELKNKHKIVSELYSFPDKTSKTFYHQFNKELLYSLGVIATDEMLETIFNACSYLPWQAFDDTSVLREINVKKAILSNFHSGLDDVVNKYFKGVFDSIIVSEIIGLRKPDVKFYEKAIETLSVPAEEIIYIGDSIKLDMEPAQMVGMKAHLIDRDGLYPLFKNRINSLAQIKNLI